MESLTLETARIFLRGFYPKDIAYIFDNLPKNEIKRILGHRNEEEYLTEEKKHKNGYSSYNRSFLLFLLTDKASNKIIGRCGLHNWNTDNRRAEIGYVMEDENFRRAGLMTEAVEIILDYGFNTLKLNRIEALVGNDNIPSIRLMEKNNFIREALLRQHVFSEGKYQDSILFSRLFSEYLQEKKC